MLSFDTVRNAARGRWPEIWAAFGVPAEYLKNQHGPCFGCGGKDRARVDDKDGSGSFYCNGGGNPVSGDGFDYLCHVFNWDRATCLREVAAYLGIDQSSAPPPAPPQSAKHSALSEEDRERSRAKLRRQFSDAAKIAPTGQTAAYLSGRGLILDSFPQTLRDESARYWLPAEPAPVDLGPCAAMLAAIQGPDDKLVGLHRTFIRDGRKAMFTHPESGDPLPAKKMRAAWPGATRGGAVRLHKAGRELVVAEGIETALAAHLITGRPAWAALSAGGLSAVVFPEKTTDVLIAADADNAGQNAARTLAARLVNEGRTARIAAPEKGGDWADVIAGGAAHG